MGKIGRGDAASWEAVILVILPNSPRASAISYRDSKYWGLGTSLDDRIVTEKEFF